MGKFSLNTIEDLTKFGESLKSVIEGRIDEMKVTEKMNSIPSLPFGTIKYLFESISDRLFDIPEGKKLIAQYVKTIKESKELKKMYLFMENISKPIYVRDASMFLTESIDMAKITNVKNYEKSIETLSNVLKESFALLGSSHDEIEAIFNGANNALNESVDYLLKTKKTQKNLSEYVNNASVVADYLKENVLSEKPIENDCDTTECVNRLNMVSEGLSSWESDLVKDYTLFKLAGKTEEQLFEHYKSQCISLIDESLENSDVEDKSQLSIMKEQLEKLTFSYDNMMESLTNLADLKHTLHE